MQNRVYPESSGQTSSNGTEKQQRASVPANVPEDGLFAALYSERIVGYHPLISRALKLSEDVPKSLKDRHLERATVYLSNLLYWTPRSSAAGWVYKSVEEIEAETDLSRRAQDGARELLKAAGVLEERRRREIYYRVGWGALKPLLRLAIQARHVEHGQATPDAADQVRHVEHGGNDRHVEQRTKYDMSSAEKVRHVEQPSISTTRDEQPALEHPSIDAREANAGDGGARPAEEATGTDGLIDGEGGASKGREESTTGPRRPSAHSITPEGSTENGSGSEGQYRTVRLKDRILDEAAALGQISEEALRIRECLAEALGSDPGQDSGAALARISEYAIRKDIVELLAEVAIRAREVRSPLRFFAHSLALAIKDEEAAPRQPRPGSPAERFEAALGARGGSSPESGTLGHTAAGEGGEAPPDGRFSLAGSNAPAYYGVRDASAQPDFKDYFVRGGREGREQKERLQREREDRDEREEREAEARGETGTST